MAQRAPGDGYYDRIKKEKRQWSVEMHKNSEDRSALREAFAAAAEDKREDLQARLDINSEAQDALFKRFEALQEKENNPPWIALSHALLSADYKKVEELTRDGTLIKLMNEERVPVIGQSAYAGDDKIAKLTIERGADLEMTGAMLETPLLTTTYKDNVGVFKLLVKAGADIKAKNSAGQDVREMAEEYGADKILGVLDALDRKAAKTSKAKPGKTRTP